MGCASSSPSYPSVPGHSVTKTGSKMAKIVKATGPHHLSLDIQARFIANDSSGMIQAEYVWIGGNNELRCKTKVPRPPLSAHTACPLSRLTYHDVPVACTQTLTKAPSSPEDLPVWNFDGSSTEQPGSDSEVLLVPCAIYRDPFRVSDEDGSSPHILVLCDCYKPDPDAPKGVGEAIPTNTRVACKAIMDKVKAKEPWFGIEQEYTLFEPDGATPYGWPDCSNGLQYPDRPQGPYYCSIGTENAFGRPIVEAHYAACMCTLRDRLSQALRSAPPRATHPAAPSMHAPRARQPVRRHARAHACTQTRQPTRI